MFNEKEVETRAKTFLKVFKSREGIFCVERLYSYLLSLGYCPIECTTSTMEYVLRDTALEKDSKVSIVRCNRCDGTETHFYKFVFIDKEQAKSEKDLLKSILCAVGAITLEHFEKRGYHITLADQEREINYFFEVILQNIKE